MESRTLTRRFGDRTGLTLMEVLFATAIFSLLMVTATLNVHSDARALSALARTTALETKAEEMLERVAGELQYAQGDAPTAWLAEDLSAAETLSVDVDTTQGFPDRGVLLLEPGTASEERIAYETFATAPSAFASLTRGERCDSAASHASGTLVRWSDSAVHLEDQAAPPAGFFDGVSRETVGDVFYRGDGTGFSFRVPTDPTGGMDYFDAAGAVRWGATVGGAPSTDGWACLRFEAVAVVAEAARAADLNGDGDRDDAFDLGRLVLRSWDASDPAVAATEIALSPPMILQERCAWGSDLDADGFEDPMFLWDPATGRLRLRLFLLTSTRREVPEVRSVERVLFLRNGARG